MSDEEKIRVLEKRILRLEEMVARGAQAQYFFCPSLNCWLPAQCDDEGRLVIDPSDLDTRYYTQTAADVLLAELLKIDGSRKAELIDIDGGAGKWDKIFTKTCLLKCHPTAGIPYFYFKNRADTGYAAIYAATVNIEAFRPLGTIGQFMTGDVDKSIVFLGATGAKAVNLELMRIINESVKLINLPVADPSILNALWNDGGTVKISAG